MGDVETIVTVSLFFSPLLCRERVRHGQSYISPLLIRVGVQHARRSFGFPDFTVLCGRTHLVARARACAIALVFVCVYRKRAHATS
eukprot:3201641-Pleurochrysis_carterae.AAC.2